MKIKTDIMSPWVIDLLIKFFFSPFCMMYAEQIPKNSGIENKRNHPKKLATRKTFITGNETAKRIEMNINTKISFMLTLNIILFYNINN